MMQADKPVLSVRALSHHFVRADGTEVTALNRVSLDVSAGEFVCILGRSGHGKTTLLNIVAGLLPTEQGGVRVLDQPITGPGIDRGVIFQKDAVFPWMRVADNVDFGLRMRGLKKGRERPDRPQMPRPRRSCLRRQCVAA
jgi:NitT/TauT family transport system ATP-binding protein